MSVDVRKLILQQQYGPAEQLLRRRLDQMPDAQAEYLLGFTLLQTQRYKEAEPYLRSATGQQLERDDWLMALAESLHKQGQHQAAVDVLDRAIALRPRASYFYARAMSSLSMGDSPAAEQALRQCLEQEPKHADALYRLGEILMGQGNYAESIGYLERSLAVNPNNLEVLYWVGVTQQGLDRVDIAEEVFRTVLEDIPGHVGALHNLGMLLLRSGRTAEGRKMLEYFREMSLLRDDIEFHKHALELEPGNLNGRISLAGLLLKIGDNQEALQQLLQARTQAPDNAHIYELLSEAFQRLGNEDNARKASSYAAQLRSNTP